MIVEVCEQVHLQYHRDRSDLERTPYSGATLLMRSCHVTVHLLTFSPFPKTYMAESITFCEVARLKRSSEAFKRGRDLEDPIRLI